MKRTVCVIGTVSILVGILLSSCAPRDAEVAKQESRAVATTTAATKQSWEVEWDKTVEAARREGTLRIYDNWGSQVHTDIAKNMKEKFGIDVEYTFVAKGNELVTKMEMERQAGLYLADVIGDGANTMLGTMKPKGLITPIEPMLMLPEAMDTKVRVTGELYRDKGKHLIELSAECRQVVARNTEMVKDGEIKSFYDILNPKWKGQVVLNDPTVTGAGNNFVTILVGRYGLDKGREFLRQLKKQEPQITRDTRLQVEWMAKGKYALTLGAQVSTLIEFKNLGAPVEIVKVQEGGLMGAGSGFIALPSGKLPHPNAAKVFINWILTREGQTVFGKAWLQPSGRTDVFIPGVEDSVAKPGDPFIVVTEETMAMTDELLALGREVLPSP